MASPRKSPLPVTSIAADVRAGAAWSIVAMVFVRLLGFASLLVLARVLAPENFGVVAAVVVFLSFVELASDAGMKASVVYEQETGISSRVETAFTISLIASVALTALGIALAPVIAGFFRIEEHTDLFRLASLSVLFTGLANVQDGLLQRDLAFRRRLFAETLRAGLRASVSIALALAGFGAASLVWGMLAGSVGWMAFLTFQTRIRPTLRLDRAAARSLGSYGASSLALATIAAATSRLDAIVIGRLLGERALGIYTVAFRVPELAIQAVAWQLSVVIFPALSRKRVADQQGLPAATLRLMRLQSLYVIPVAALIAVLAEPLVETLFGPAWEDAAAILVPLSVLSAVFSAVFPLGDLLKATGRQGVLVALNLATAPLTVVSMVAVAPRGLLAVAWVRVGASVLFVAMLVIATAHYARVPAANALRTAVPALVAAAGIVLAAEAARLACGCAAGIEVLTGALAGAVGGAVSLAVLAPSTFAEARESIPALAQLRRGRRPATAAAEEQS